MDSDTSTDADSNDDAPEEFQNLEPAEDPRGTGSWRTRLNRTFLKQPASGEATQDTATPSSRTLTDAEVRAKVMRIDPTERKIGYLGAALGVVMSLTFTIPYLVNPKTGASKPTKATSKSCGLRSAHIVINHVGYCKTIIESRGYWLVTLLILLAFPLAIFITVRIGRRSPLAYAALMTGLAFEVTLGLFGLPFLFAGGWLLLRAWKSQKYGSPTAKRGDPPLVKAAPSRSTASSKKKSSAKKKAEPVSSGRRPAEANKRYTPKAPPKKKIPPPS